MKQVTIAVDHGNGTSKIVCSIDGESVQPFKVPSVLRKVDPVDASVQIDKVNYLVGKEAILAKSGNVSTPFSTGDKIKGLSAVIAYALHQVLGEPQSIALSVGVATPFVAGEGTKAAILDEVKILRKGFSVAGSNYKVERLDQVVVKPEAAGILEANPIYNASIDAGYGTILSYFRDRLANNKISMVSCVDGEIGGVNLLVKELRNNPEFSDAMRKAGVNAVPSAEVLTSVISKGAPFVLRGVDLLEHIYACSSELVSRVNQAIDAARSSFVGNQSFDDDAEFRPVLIGGGAALIQALIDAGKPIALNHNAVVFGESPDYQNALIIHQSLVTEAKANDARKAQGTKNSSKQVHSDTSIGVVGSDSRAEGLAHENIRESDRSADSGSKVAKSNGAIATPK